MAISKVVYAGNTLVDLTSDTVSASTLASGVTAHTASGEQVTGTMSTEPSDYAALKQRVATLEAAGKLYKAVPAYGSGISSGSGRPAFYRVGKIVILTCSNWMAQQDIASGATMFYVPKGFAPLNGEEVVPFFDDNGNERKLYVDASKMTVYNSGFKSTGDGITIESIPSGRWFSFNRVYLTNDAYPDSTYLVS